MAPGAEHKLNEVALGRIFTFGQRFGGAVILGTIGLTILCVAAAFLIGPKVVPGIYERRLPALEVLEREQ